MKTIHTLDCPEQAGLGPQSDPSRSLLYLSCSNEGYGKVPEFFYYSFVCFRVLSKLSQFLGHSPLSPSFPVPSPLSVFPHLPVSVLSPSLSFPLSLSLACCWAGLGCTQAEV